MITYVSLNDQATGMAQTLANLFDNYPNDKILFCTPQNSSGRFKYFNTTVYEGIAGNRFVKKFLPHLSRKYFDKVMMPVVVKKILAFQPDLILVSNLSYQVGTIAMQVYGKTKIPICLYLMDYIEKHNRNDFETLYQPLMKNATWHIFISKFMEDYYLKTYPGISNNIVVHNPVAEDEITGAPVMNGFQSKISFAYAGSLWQMHIDALMAFASAVQLLQRKGVPVQLTIYTAGHFYKMYRHRFETMNIRYGGFYNYETLKPHLKKYNALLIASSFEKSYYGFSAYSVQTKVTDYLATGVPVISIGPSYSACNKFIQENNCGLVIDTKDHEQVALKIENFIHGDMNCIFERAANGIRLIKENYIKDAVQQNLYRFLADIEKKAGTNVKILNEENLG